MDYGRQHFHGGKSQSPPDQMTCLSHGGYMFEPETKLHIPLLLDVRVPGEGASRREIARSQSPAFYLFRIDRNEEECVSPLPAEWGGTCINGRLV